MGHDIEIGMRIGDLEPRPYWLDMKLSDRELSAGDLVTYTLTSFTNGMTVYRITKDCPPNPDLIWGVVRGRPLPTLHKMAWMKPGTHAPVPNVRLRGCIEITPVFQFLPGPSASKRTVSYDTLYRVRKVDVVELGRSFANFQSFIDEEVRRLKES